MNRSVVTGFLGELVLGALLQADGYAVEHYGGQHGVDVCVPKLRVRIDVKTSTLKTELGMRLWGWALQSGSKKKALNFTHVVCVALDEAFQLSALYVVNVADLEKFPAGVSPFKNNKRIFLVPRDNADILDLDHLKKDQAEALKLSSVRVREGVVRVATNSTELAEQLGAPSAPRTG
jgi:hypothetical protein